MTIEILLTLSSAPVLACSTYLFVLTLFSRRLPPRSGQAETTRFVIVIPAHDEEMGIARTVKSLLSADYPHDRRRVLVVADNCTDDTADRARSAGANVLVRNEPSKRGKGYALAAAFENVLQDENADAVVVVDA